MSFSKLSKLATFNRLATASSFIEFNPKWLDLDNLPVFALTGGVAPIIEPYHVRSSIDSHGYRYIFIGKEENNSHCNTVIYETESKDSEGEEELRLCFYSDSTGELRVVDTKTSEEQIKYICQLYAKRIDYQLSEAQYQAAKLLDPSFTG